MIATETPAAQQGLAADARGCGASEGGGVWRRPWLPWPWWSAPPAQLKPDPLYGTMRTALLLTTALLIAQLQLGCAAPGSAIGHIFVEGSLSSSAGEPVAGRTVEMLLPATYGLGGLDLVMNEPDDFGHQDEEFSTKTGPDGSFRFDLGNRIYHMTFWLLPPLGGFPRNPPPPFMLVRIPDLGGEYVAVETATGRFKLFSKDGAELSLEESALAAVSASNFSDSLEDGRSTTGAVHLVLDAR